MMPSRGLHIARGQVQRLQHLQTRNLSSASSRLRTIRFSTPTGLSATRSQWLAAAPISYPAVSAIRHASTHTAAAQVASPPASSPAMSNLDTITLDNLDLASTMAIPERIGFLSELGLNYGYGITSSLEWIIEHLYITAGLPWWASIAATACLVRLATFPLYIRSSDASARQSAMAPVLAPLMDTMKKAQKAGDKEGTMMAYKNLADVRKRAGLSMTAMFVPIAVQGIIGFCGFRLTRAMASLPVPGIDAGGFLWLKDLTVPDPFLILPLTMAGIIHLLIRRGGETGAANPDVMTPAMKNMMLYGMPGLMALVTGFQPGAVAVWFATTTSMSIIQAQVLQSASLRRALGIAPIYKPTKEEAKDINPFAALMDGLKPKDKPKENVRPVYQTAKSQSSTQSQKPQYQAPNVRTRTRDNKASEPRAPRQSGRVIDVKATKRS